MQATDRRGADRAEIARFDALAGRWWDPRGPMRPLHEMNPARIGWIDTLLRRRFGERPVRILDVGCGAGLAAEALARRGHAVLGIDASAAAIAAAAEHAAAMANAPAYREAVAADLLAEGARFDAVTALEVIEHVPNPESFVAELAALTEPGGLVVFSTLNRTARSFTTAKLGAEYIVGLLPAGTHDWRKFVTPQELAAMMRRSGLRPAEVAGLRYRPLSGQWQIGTDPRVNYLIAGER